MLPAVAALLLTQASPRRLLLPTLLLPPLLAVGYCKNCWLSGGWSDKELWMQYSCVICEWKGQQVPRVGAQEEQQQSMIKEMECCCLCAVERRLGGRTLLFLWGVLMEHLFTSRGLVLGNKPSTLRLATK